ncbi:MAG: hypothetical protein WBM90_08735 [Acidimicrobiia bacterium]
MRLFGRVVLVLLLVGTLGALGYGVWNAGYQQGLVETVETTADVVVTAPYYPAIYGFGVFGLIFKAFFAFVIFGLIFKFFFGWRHWHRRGDDEGNGFYRSRMEDRLGHWHEQAHRSPPQPEPGDG